MTGVKADTAKLVRAMQVFRAEWEYFPMHVALMFICIAEADVAGSPLSISRAAELTGMPDASVSRNVRVLSGGQPGRGGSAEHDLLQVFTDPTDYRSRLIRLTPRGRDFYRQLLTALK
jgi:DNA-binding MarR family transcriptional regulator